MGTRGGMGFRIDKSDKIQYNQYDTYPEGLGRTVAEFIINMVKIGKVRDYADMARNLRLIGEDEEPTDEDRAQFAAHADSGVSTGRDFYALLRNLQGDPEATLESGVILDAADFLMDSLFCEYAYIVNFDEQVLEFYKGFVSDPDKCFGRYAKGAEPNRQGYDYYPVTLAAKFSFPALVQMGADRAVAAMDLACNLEDLQDPEEVEALEYEALDEALPDLA